MTLSEFLMARFAEREEAARAAMVGDGKWHADDRFPSDSVRASGEDYVGDLADEHIQQHVINHDPAFVLDDCAAKRRIVERHAPEGGAEDWMDADWLSDMSPEEKRGWCGRCTYDARTVWSPCPDLRDLALPFASHPDYRPEWSPDA